MHFVEIDSYLDNFRSKTKLKGDSVLSRLQSLYDRWKKVIEDCEKSSDTSAYRSQFLKKHKEYYNLLNNNLCNKTEVLEIVSTIKNIRETAIQEILDGRTLMDKDAICFIIVELELVLG
jgi:hypothetical protein